jgi:hypothetical protein
LWKELIKNLSNFGVGLVGELTLTLDCGEETRMFRLEVIHVFYFELSNIGSGDFIEISFNTGVENNNLLFNWHWDVLLLLKELSELLSSVKELLSSGIKIGTELGESSNLSVLGELKLHGTRDLLHGLDLGSRSDS